MAFKRTVPLREFSISRHQIWCAHAIVVQRMHACACKMPSCWAQQDFVHSLPISCPLLQSMFISFLKTLLWTALLCNVHALSPFSPHIFLCLSTFFVFSSVRMEYILGRRQAHSFIGVPFISSFIFCLRCCTVGGLWSNRLCHTNSFLLPCPYRHGRFLFPARGYLCQYRWAHTWSRTGS